MSPHGEYTKSHPERVYKLALLGLTNIELCTAFGISEQTLINWTKRYPTFKNALDDGKQAADAEVALGLFKRARGYITTEEKAFVIDGVIQTVQIKKEIIPDVKAASFWLKNRTAKQTLGWNDSIHHELTGRDQGPIVINPNQVDLKDFTTEELLLMKSMTNKLTKDESDIIEEAEIVEEDEPLIRTK